MRLTSLHDWGIGTPSHRRQTLRRSLASESVVLVDIHLVPGNGVASGLACFLVL